MRSILLVDDDNDLLIELEAAVRRRLAPAEVELRKWVPRGDEGDPRATFDSLIDGGTTLVVADYDLTARGQTGLFGATIVDWCQARAIPVGDFSRGARGGLPKEPNLFELRVPTDVEAASGYIAAIFRGFVAMKQALETRSGLLFRRSPAAVLADILGVPEDENQFALYGSRFGGTSGALLEQIGTGEADGARAVAEKKIALVSYVIGHLLVNAVLRFSGPIVSVPALKAYVASDQADSVDVQEVFQSARYRGPFAELEVFYWLAKVDVILEGFASMLPGDSEAETAGEIHRLALEGKLGRKLRRHDCARCGGQNGGFFCPFTGRTVCHRGDCSVGASSWIPQGARLCRFERDFFEEWAPILGF